MSWFVVIGGLLLLGILVALLRPLVKGQFDEPQGDVGVRELNLNILREQSLDLEKDFKEGRLDQSGYDQGRQELERRTLEDAGKQNGAFSVGQRKVKLAVAIAVVFPAIVVALYAYLGTPDALIGKPTPVAGAENNHALSAEQISGMVEKLALRLQENPEDGQGWLMLGRSYAVLGRYPESSAAFGRAMMLLPPDAQHYADFADITAMAQGKSLLGEPENLVKRALALDPNNMKALALSGTMAFERQNYRQAIAEWQKVLALVPEESPVANGIQGSIRDAENRMAISGKRAETTQAVPDAPVAVATVGGVIELDAKLLAQVKPDDTVFVFARAVDGPKMPVAMLRKKVSDLPLRFSLDDSMSMSPRFKLSTVGQVVIGARVSKSGDALSRSGDFEGLSAPVAVGSNNVKILIESVVK